MKPKSWKQIVQICKQYRENTDAENLAWGQQLNRSPSVDAAYQAFKSVKTSSLFEELFPDDRRCIFTLNPFPYHIAKDVIHGLLWFRPSSGGIVPQTDTENAISVITDFFDVAWYENPRLWKSVPMIPHVQVFLHNPHCFNANLVQDTINQILQRRVCKRVCQRKIPK